MKEKRKLQARACTWIVAFLRVRLCFAICLCYSLLSETKLLDQWLQTFQIWSPFAAPGDPGLSGSSPGPGDFSQGPLEISYRSKRLKRAFMQGTEQEVNVGAQTTRGRGMSSSLCHFYRRVPEHGLWVWPFPAFFSFSEIKSMDLMARLQTANPVLAKGLKSKT